MIVPHFGIVAIYAFGAIILISFIILAKNCFQIRRLYRRDPGRVKDKINKGYYINLVTQSSIQLNFL